MGSGPKPYAVVFDSDLGLQYVFESGLVQIPEAPLNAITALTGDVTATGPGSAAATISSATVTGKLLTGYISGAGTVAATDTILQAINKLNGNTALKQATLSNVLSSASVGGAANEELTIAGLLTTSTIYAVTQSVPGANNVAMIGFTNDTNGSLKIIWTANPGAGAKVVVTFI